MSGSQALCASLTKSVLTPVYVRHVMVHHLGRGRNVKENGDLKKVEADKKYRKIEVEVEKKVEVKKQSIPPGESLKICVSGF